MQAVQTWCQHRISSSLDCLTWITNASNQLVTSHYHVPFLQTRIVPRNWWTSCVWVFMLDCTSDNSEGSKTRLLKNGWCVPIFSIWLSKVPIPLENDFNRNLAHKEFSLKPTAFSDFLLMRWETSALTAGMQPPMTARYISILINMLAWLCFFERQMGSYHYIVNVFISLRWPSSPTCPLKYWWM